MAKTTAFGPSIRPGTVVEFMHGDQPQLAWVLEDSSGKLRLLTINKRETKLPAARLLPWTGPVLSADASRQDIQNELNERQEARGEIQAGLDVMELWELAQGEVESAPLDWFAGLLWEDPDADRLAALGRAMLQAKTHFKFRPPLFDIYPADKVEARLQQQAEEKEREAITSAGQTLLQNLWSAYNQGRKPRPDLAPELAEGLARILRRQVARHWTRTNARYGRPSARGCRTCRIWPCSWPRPGASCPPTTTTTWTRPSMRGETSGRNPSIMKSMK